MFGLIHKHKKLAAIVIAVASLSFLFWMFSVADVKQMFGLKRCVAVVEGYCITPREFSRELMRYQNLLEKKELKNIVKRQVLYSLVNREILYQKARSVGIVASDREVAEVIENDPNFKKNGKFSISVYREILERSGLTPEEYESRLKKVLTIRKLFKFMEKGVYLSDRELDFQERVLSARFSGRAYLLSPSSVKLNYKPSVEELKKFYSENREAFSVPPSKRFRVWVTEDKEKAHTMYGELKRGKVPGGGSVYGDKELPSYISKQADKLNMEDPVTLTKKGGKYYVIYLEKSLPGRVKSFEEAKEEVEKILLERKKTELLKKLATEIKDKLSRGEKVERKFIRFDRSTVEEFITLFKIKGDEVLRLVFSKEKVFGPYRTAGGYAVLYIEKRSFDRKSVKNRERLRESLLKAKMDSLINLFVERLLDRVSVKINEEYLR